MFRVRFDHGLGDCVNLCYILELYRRRGLRFSVSFGQSKAFLLKVMGFDTFDWPGEAFVHPCVDAPGCHSFNGIPWFGNRPRANMTFALPKIGTEDALWEELQQVRIRAADAISGEAKAWAASFLDGLPRPVVLFHSHGDSSPWAKNLRPHTCQTFYDVFLREGPGSLVLLDWKSPADCVRQHERIRSVRDADVHLERLGALIDAADLLVGIDSGPIHYLRMFDTPGVGVWRHYLPNHHMIPTPKVANLVPGRHGLRFAPMMEYWNLRLYPRDEPNGSDIFGLCRDVLAARRH